jgi:hypothetical protein
VIFDLGDLEHIPEQNAFACLKGFSMPPNHNALACLDDDELIDQPQQ